MSDDSKMQSPIHEFDGVCMNCGTLCRTQHGKATCLPKHWSDYDVGMAELAKEALAVQDACNLSGVVHSFSRTMTRLRELLGPKAGTDEINHHPISVLWASKIESLTGSFGIESFTAAYDWAKLMASHGQVSQIGEE